MKKEKRSIAAGVIEELLKAKQVKKKELAAMMEKDPTKLSVLLTQKIRFDDVAEIANLLGFDIIFRPTTDREGMVKVQTDNPCEGCRYIKFSEALEDAIKNLHTNFDGAGAELDFYQDRVPNPETEIKFPDTSKMRCRI